MSPGDISKPTRIQDYLLPKSILLESKKYLRTYGMKRYEGYMCWSGIALDAKGALIRSCIFPTSIEESEFRSFHARLDLSVVADIGERVHAKNEFLLAQLHTHGFEAFHSAIDDKYPISHKVGFISVVIGNFARRRFFNEETLVGCSVNEHLGGGKWRELGAVETKRRFHVIGG